VREPVAEDAVVGEVDSGGRRAERSCPRRRARAADSTPALARAPSASRGNERRSRPDRIAYQRRR
jgi:hypothetical protein